MGLMFQSRYKHGEGVVHAGLKDAEVRFENARAGMVKRLELRLTTNCLLSSFDALFVRQPLKGLY